MPEAPPSAPPSAPDPPLSNSELLHVTAASLHTPESFGRAIIAAALSQAGESGGDGSLDRTVPATIKVRPVGGRTTTSSTDAPVVCIDVCVGIGPFEACIHIVIPEEVVGIFLP